MPELRKDYFTKKLVLVATEREKRPTEQVTIHNTLDSNKKTCPFCPGNEETTPPADLVLVSKGNTLLKLSDSEDERVDGWSVRYFPNKFPAVATESDAKYTDYPLQGEPAFGYHYIMVVTPEHFATFGNLPVEQWIDVLATLQDRVRWLYSKKTVGYVSVFANNGYEAGASFSHPHMQTITLTKLPPTIEEEAEAMHDAMTELGVCPMCKVVNVESNSARSILSTENFLAFAPWASSHAYEFWVFPKRHETSFLKVSQKEIQDLATMLRSTLGALDNALNEPSYNIAFHISSEKKTTKQIHWHIEVYPQIVKWAGMELGSGVYINPIRPETAAELIGAAARKELAQLIGIT
ncbi:MAG: galactose-1-phosphate uridylyltransferase [Nitrososphaerales archaeon]